MIRSLLIFNLLFWVFYPLPSQVQIPSSTAEQLQTHSVRKKLLEQSICQDIGLRNVGPTIFGGRVVDIEANSDQPHIFYVAFASGGLWKTINNGASFVPLFDSEASMTIGDIAVDWKHGIIYVGTGENNSSRSSYSGTGMYKSYNDGKSWIHCGLIESQHIGRIVLDQQDSLYLSVAVLGHLYSKNKERGVYISRDGGTSWIRTLFINDSTGVVDLISDPIDPNTLYAAAWTRMRTAWNLTESGPGSAIYKSTDHGLNWIKISGVLSGFPEGENVGRIGLSMFHQKDTAIIYAVLDQQERRPAKEKIKTDLQKNDFKSMSIDQLLAIKDDRLEKFLRDNGFPKKYSAAEIKKLVSSNKVSAKQIAEYLEDGNSLLFDTPVKGSEIYRSMDLGKTWIKTHDGFFDGLYYSYGYYFGQIRVDPKDWRTIYLLGVPLLKSKDAGKTFVSIDEDNQHGDHHALWVNPEMTSHLINGNDGGINISYDGGIQWSRCTHPPVGQFYSIQYDLNEPYNIYGGTQDNGVWKGSSKYTENTGWQISGNYPYKSILGGDGMQVDIDNREQEFI
ncbi:MAG: glycosyl hydrolase, partial [Bacteroidota bacterium]|nr:glycosyl hydrolase [Bacteroidota bacterium]